MLRVQQMYSKMRYFFEPLHRVQICTVSDTLNALQRPAAVTILPSVGGLVSIADRCSVSSVRACVCRCVAWSALHLARPALLPVMCIRSGCAGGCGLHLWGIWGEPGVGRSTPRVEKIQKRRFSFLPTPSFLHKTPPPLSPIPKIFQKYKKTPTKGLCSVLYLPYKP